MSKRTKSILILSMSLIAFGLLDFGCANAKTDSAAPANAVQPNSASPLLIAQAQPATSAPPGSASAMEQPKQAAVVVNGKELFKVYGESESAVENRIRMISAAIGKLVDDPTFHPSSLTIQNNTDSSDIVFGDRHLFSITQADEVGSGLPRSAVAEKWLTSIKNTIESERYRRNLSDAIDQVRLGTVKTNLLYFLGNPVSLRIGISLIGLLILFVVSYSIRKSIPKYFHESNKRYTISKIAEFSSYFICLLFLSIVFSDTLGSLAVVLGAATAGIALALKDMIVSIAGWIAIIFGDTYKVGDRVQISGVKGDVIDVGLVRTTLMELGEWVQGDLYTGRIVRVANGSIFAGPTYNYSRDLPFIWDEVVIKVNPESDPGHARCLILKVCEETVGEYVTEANLGWQRLKDKYLVDDEKIEPMVTMVIADGKFEFTARYPVDYRQRRTAKDKIFSGIVEQFEATSGAVEFA